MHALLLAAAEADLIGIFSQFGFPVATAVALMFYFYRRETALAQQVEAREQRLSERINILEDFIRRDLQKLSERVTAALVDNGRTMHDLANSVSQSNQAVAALLHRLTDRPCLLPQEDTPDAT